MLQQWQGGSGLDRQQFTSNIDTLLQKYCRSKVVEGHSIGEAYVQLWGQIETYLLAGGKRVRPYLVYLTYRAYGGGDDAAITAVAAAWELLHACLLIHDDIIDRDTMRHGKPNIAGTYERLYQSASKEQAPHYALSAALLAGDLLLSASHEVINQSNFTADQKLLAQQHIADAIFVVGGGEFIDFESALHPIQSVDVNAISHHKTASYSFQIPMQCGAQLAEASDEQCKLLDKLGLQIGIAFQLRDDLLGVFGDEATTGKSNRSDIFEKKRTMLVQLAQHNVSKADADRLEYLYDPSHTLSDEEAEQVYELIRKSGAKDMVEKEISRRVASADTLAAQLDVPEDYRKRFVQLIDKVAIRSR